MKNFSIKPLDKKLWKAMADECDDPIINLCFYTSNQELYAIYNNSQIEGLINYWTTAHMGNIVLWLKDFNSSDMISIILNQFVKSKLNTKDCFKLNTQLFDFQMEYKKIFCKIGFKQELYLREHYILDNIYHSVIFMCIDNFHD